MKRHWRIVAMACSLALGACPSGQWRSADGSIVREQTYVLGLVHADDAASEEAIGDIIATYKARFRQEAVLRVRNPVCIAL